MQRFTIILMLGLAVAGCASTAPSGPSVGAISAEAEQAQRPLRQAYALKFVEYAKSEEELKQVLVTSTRKGIEEAAPRYFPEDPKRMIEIFNRVILPEVERRLPEVKEILASAFADVLTTDELRRLSEFVSLPGYRRTQTRQPLTEQDKREMAALGLPELQKRLEATRPQYVELAKTRGEIWGKKLVDEMFQQKPDLFREKSA